MSAGGLCPLCQKRKAKRPCPAKQASICSVCCGTKRRVEIDCPPDCVYLTGAHAPAWEGRESDRRHDLTRLLPQLERLSQDQAAVFFYLLSGMVGISARHRDADDARWQEAIHALGKTFETRESGLIYEHAAEGWEAQSLVREMQDVLRPPQAEGPVAPDRDLRAVLAAIEGAIEATRREGAEPKAFLATASRLTARLVQTEEKPAADTPPAPSKLIQP